MKLPEELYCNSCEKVTTAIPKMDAVKNGCLVCEECRAENRMRYPSESPERWVVVKIENDSPYYKVFGSWAGGYLDGDRWRMNSGIARVEEDLDYYYFYGHSGSCYQCHKKGYGVATSYSQGILDNIMTRSPIAVEVLNKDQDWINLLNQNER